MHQRHALIRRTAVDHREQPIGLAHVPEIGLPDLIRSAHIRPVGLEFVIRPPLEAGPCPGSGRSNAHG